MKGSVQQPAPSFQLQPDAYRTGGKFGLEAGEAADIAVAGSARVAVCMATYLRPEGLRRALESLEGLTFVGREPAVEIYVIDNDPAGSASATCEEVGASLRWPIRYVHEPRRGIAQVRNTAFDAARHRADFIAFLDDDEAADPHWLDELLRAQAASNADAVLGPTLRVFDREPPDWVRNGGYFEQPRYPTGSTIAHGGIGNSLIHTRVLSDAENRFDERLGISGGEDTLFFLRLARQGGRIVWSDEATVQEFVPEHRARLGWVLKRVYRTANTWSFCERELGGSAAVLAVRVLKGVARLGLGLGLLTVSPVLGRERAVRGLWQLCYGAGNLTGLFGWRYDAYRNISSA